MSHACRNNLIDLGGINLTTFFLKKEFNTFLESTIQPITKMTENLLSNEKIESASNVYNSCRILAIVT